MTGARHTGGIGRIVPDQSGNRPVHLTAHNNLLPSHGPTAAGGKHIRHLIGKIALQLRCFAQPLALHQRLTVGATLPTGIHGLIAADIHIFRRKNSAHLIEHILQEIERRLLAGANQVAADKVLHRHLILLAGAGEPGIGHNRREDVRRKFHLRNNLYIAIGGIFH